MIEQTKFLGMPLKTQMQRRRLVVGYYTILLFFCGMGLWKSKGQLSYVWVQTITLGGMLGGIKVGGPVKAYAEQTFPLDATDGTISLNLAGRKPFDSSMPGGWSPLDEREVHQRDAAHYRAYKILRWTLGVGLVMVLLSMNWTEAWFASRWYVFAWIVLVYVLGLPQSVLLWTEPDHAGELAEVQLGRGKRV